MEDEIKVKTDICDIHYIYQDLKKLPQFHHLCSSESILSLLNTAAYIHRTRLIALLGRKKEVE